MCYMGQLKERISHVTWDDQKERICKEFLACLVQFLHKKPPKLGSKACQKRGGLGLSP